MTHPQPPSDREPLIDWLRGFAALAVVMFHYFHASSRDGWVPLQTPAALSLLSSYGYLGVHLFFMISGYVIMMTAQRSTLRRFAASRVSRLLPAFWVCMVLTALVELAVSNAPIKPQSWAQFFANLTLVPTWFGQEPMDGAYWSLTVEITFYLWVALVILCGQIRHMEKLLLGWLLIALINFLRPMYTVQLFTVAQWAPLFAAGAYCYAVRQSGWTRLRVGGLLASWLLAQAYAWRETGKIERIEALWAFGQGPTHLGTAALILLFFALFLGIATGRLRVRESRISDFLGRLTYPLYLIHQHVGYALITAGASMGLAAAIGSTPLILGVMAIVMLVAWAVNLGVEQPLAPRLRRWIEGRRRRAPEAGALEGAPPA
jgi:peptidoglycan/LPS O-acetylase OafA/YrhL